MKLSKIYSDGMILQRGKENRIAGKASKDEMIRIEFRGKNFYTQADAQGNWSVVLPVFHDEDGFGPFVMKISSSKGDGIFLRDILYGDVFLLGGQSNMELPIDRVRDVSQEDILSARDFCIRMFQIAKEPAFSDEPMEITSGEWIPVTPETIQEFSAIGYYFAKYHRAWKDVPVGLIHTAVGGVPVEVFMSEDNLRRTAEKIRETHTLTGSCDGNKNMGCLYCYDKLLQQDKDPAYVDKVKRADAERIAAWNAALEQNDPGPGNGWTEKWQQQDAAITIPGFLTGTIYEHYFGSLWLQKTIEVPFRMTKEDALLALGTLVDADKTYVNGELVGETAYRYPPRRYPIRKGLLKPGENVISVRLTMDSNIGGAVPDMPYYLRAGKETIDLRGEWKLRKGFACDRLEGETFFIWHPTALFQSMIAPLQSISLKAVLFYQGESNCGYPQYYKELLIAMVNEWRLMFGNVPFYMIELAKYLGDGPEYILDPFDGIRSAQQEAVKELQNVYLVKNYDLGQYNELHPQNKSETAKRLFALYQQTMQEKEE